VQPPFQLTRNVTLLGTEHFNLYLIKGETLAIMEGGKWNHLPLPATARPGKCLSRIDLLFNHPHSHFDHMMAFSRSKKGTLDEDCHFAVEPGDLFKRTDPLQDFESDRKMTLALMERGLISEARVSPALPRFQSIWRLKKARSSISDAVFRSNLSRPWTFSDLLSGFLEEEGILSARWGRFYTLPTSFDPIIGIDSMRLKNRSIG
jgi:hypothetical protein